MVKTDSFTADLRLFNLSDKVKFSIIKTGANGIEVPDLKAALGKGNRFLLLVTSLSGSMKTSVKITVQLQLTVPTLDEIVGAYADGSQKLSEVHADQSVFDMLDGLAATEGKSAADYKKSIINLQSQIGIIAHYGFDIKKTGPASGQMIGGGHSFDFTYASGIMTIKREIKSLDGKLEELDQGTLNVTYDKNKGILISGSFKFITDGFYLSKTYYFPHSAYYVVSQFTASKPAATKP